MKTLQQKKQWVLWQYEDDKNGKPTKVPYMSPSRHASSTDPSTWTTYEKAKALSQVFDGFGVVFAPDQKLLGIDIDHVLDDKKKLLPEFKERIEAVIKKADTYTEFSPSKTGLHLYLYIEEALPLIAHKVAPWEVYTDGRFFTVTEDSYHKKAKKIRLVSKDEANAILALIGYPWGKDKETEETSLELIGDTLFSDEELIERMFNAKNGEKIRSTYEGDLKEYAGDASRADSALLSHLAFWSQRHAAQMERVWLSSPLGSREKTQKREDYRTRSIANAIKKCKETYKVPVENTIDFLYTLSAKGEKLLNKNTENVCRVLRHYPDFIQRYRFDEFKNRIEVFENEKWRPFVDSDAIDLQTRISIVFAFLRALGKEMTMDAVIKVAKENAVDSGAEFIRSLTWDGVARLDAWLHHTYGTPLDEYHISAGSNWMKGLVRRIIEPGCKFDYVLVLEGAQGIKKSTSLDVIGHINSKENWHVESTMSTDSKDFFMQFEGKAIIEFSEGETLSRTEVKKMKSIITTASDRYRPSYGRIAEDFPRRCVFAMTTNQEEYLKDETGNRRWLPVRVEIPSINIEWLKKNRDQLFAEAYARVIVNRETTYEFPEEATRLMQEARRISDPNEDKIADWYYNDQFMREARSEGITIQQVYTQALNGMGSMKKYDEMTIADVLKRVLRLEKKRKSVNNVQQWRWYPIEIESPLQPELMDPAMIVDGEIQDPWNG